MEEEGKGKERREEGGREGKEEGKGKERTERKEGTESDVPRPARSKHCSVCGHFSCPSLHQPLVSPFPKQISLVP
jgi:hypothetical protein